MDHGLHIHYTHMHLHMYEHLHAHTHIQLYVFMRYTVIFGCIHLMCSDKIRIVSTSITCNSHPFFVLEVLKIFSSLFVMCGKRLLTVTSLWCRARTRSFQLTKSSFSLASSSSCPSSYPASPDSDNHYFSPYF